MSSRRATRIATMIRQEIATMIVEGRFRDPAITPAITITSATVSPDLRSAKIMVSLIGADEAESERVYAALERITPFLRGELARRLKLRFAPEMRFLPDRSLEYGQEIEELVSRVLPPTAADGEDDPDASDES